MKQLLQFIRGFYISTPSITEEDKKAYVKFEAALEHNDIEAFIYEEHGRKGQVLLLAGQDLHAVTPQNLVMFRKLNRADSRRVRKFMGKIVSRYEK